MSLDASHSGRWRRMRKRSGRAIEGWLFVAPWIAGFVVFTSGPMLFALVMSFTRWGLLTEPRFVGLANYAKILTDDPLFRQSAKVTLIYTATALPLIMAIGLGMAMMLNRRLKGVSWLRALYYLPMIVPTIATAIIWKWILSPDFGLLNTFLWMYFKIKGPQWYYSDTWALPSFVMMSLWGIGGYMIIYLAGLQGIPGTFYESADIDGVNPWQRFRYITFPMLSPTVLFTMVMGVIGSFQVFTSAYMITQGGPNNATLFYMLHLYNVGFRSFRMGYASALAWIMFVAVVATTVIQFKLSSRWVYYEVEQNK